MNHIGALFASVRHSQSQWRNQAALGQPLSIFWVWPRRSGLLVRRGGGSLSQRASESSEILRRNGKMAGGAHSFTFSPAPGPTKRKIATTCWEPGMRRVGSHQLCQPAELGPSRAPGGDAHSPCPPLLLPLPSETWTHLPGECKCPQQPDVGWGGGHPAQGHRAGPERRDRSWNPAFRFNARALRSRWDSAGLLRVTLCLVTATSPALCPLHAHPQDKPRFSAMTRVPEEEMVCDGEARASADMLY